MPDWLSVSRETLQRLIELEAMVKKWTTAVNLISKNSTTEIWTRHILDSAQISVFTTPKGGKWVDLGSGGGFPALVLAVLAKDWAEPATFVLVEVDTRKAAFLLQAIRNLDLPATVIVQRIGAVDPLYADVLTARALAPLDAIMPHAVRHLKAGGRAFFPKGSTYRDEIAIAQQRWTFRCTSHQSLTDPHSAVLEVDGVALH